MKCEQAKLKILVLGGDGMLGHKFLACLKERHDVRATVRRGQLGAAAGTEKIKEHDFLFDVDANNYPSIENCIKHFKPDFVINCIGLTKSLCDPSDPRAAIYLNSLFPHMLLVTCREANAKLIHFSSDCVFNGKTGSYSEYSNPDAEDLYGSSKALGEIVSNDCVTIRKSTIGLELNSRHGLIEWLLNVKGNINGFSKAMYSGLTSLELVRVVEFIMCRNNFITGIIHIASTPISKYSLLSKLSSILNLSDIVIKDDDSFVCDRSLDSSMFKELTGYEVPSWDVMLEGLAVEIRSRDFD